MGSPARWRSLACCSEDRLSARILPLNSEAGDLTGTNPTWRWRLRALNNPNQMAPLFVASQLRSRLPGEPKLGGWDSGAPSRCPIDGHATFVRLLPATKKVPQDRRTN